MSRRSRILALVGLCAVFVVVMFARGLWPNPFAPSKARQPWEDENGRMYARPMHFSRSPVDSQPTDAEIIQAAEAEALERLAEAKEAERVGRLREEGYRRALGNR